MRNASKMALSVFAAVLVWLVASPYMYTSSHQSEGKTNPEQPAVPQVKDDGLFIPFATISTLLGVIGLAAKFG